MDIQFLLKVWGLQEPSKGNYFFLATLHAKTKEWKEHFFQWPIKESQLEKFCDDYPKEKYNIYFCNHPFQRPQRKKSFVIGSKLLWADLDETNPKDCAITPQIAWKSSDERYAALWILDKFYDSSTIEQRNKALSYNIGADKGGWDLTQVLRVPGTLNHKYSPVSRVRTLWFKKDAYNLKKFPESIYKNLDAQGVLLKYKSKIKPSTVRLLTAKRASQGKRSEVIWRLNNEMAEQGLDAQIRFNLLKGSVWNKFAGRADEDTQLMREIEKVESVKVLELPEEENDNKKSDKTIICLDTVEAEETEWLWYPYIPLGKVTLLEGDPGLGKSWFTMALASYLSSNKKLPRVSEAISGAKVLLMSVEDGIADTIRPRLDSLKGNPSRVFAYNKSVYLDEDGLAEVEHQIKKLKPTLVIIDPIVAFMGSKVDLFRANETREIMTGLAKIAEKHSCAILAVRHLTKGGKDKSIYRGMGSIDITAAARSALMIGQHPTEPDFRCICHIKSNLAPKGQTIQYSLEAYRSNPFRFEGFNDLTAEDILGAKPEDARKITEEAEAFLTNKLKSGRAYSEELYTEAEGVGIPRRALKNAFGKMKGKAVKVKGKIQWVLV